MRIERIELRLLHLPLVRHFETSFGRTIDRQFILVTVEDSGAVGIGECVADANPYYSAETTSTAWHIIAEFIAPIVLGRQFDHPREIFGALGRHPRAQHGQGGGGNGSLGSLRAPAGAAARSSPRRRANID